MRKSGSSLIFIIILLLSLAVFGGIWAYKNGLLVKPQSGASSGQANSSADSATRNIETLQPTDSVSDIDRDLAGTDILSIDKEVNGAKVDAAAP